MKTYLISAIIWLLAGILCLVSQILNLTRDGTFDITNGISIFVCLLCFVNAILNFRNYLKTKS